MEVDCQVISRSRLTFQRICKVQIKKLGAMHLSRVKGLSTRPSIICKMHTHYAYSKMFTVSTTRNVTICSLLKTICNLQITSAVYKNHHSNTFKYYSSSLCCHVYVQVNFNRYSVSILLLK